MIAGVGLSAFTAAGSVYTYARSGSGYI